MAKVVLTNQLSIKINGTELADHISQFKITVNSNPVVTNALGSIWEERVGGLKSGQVTLSFQTDYTASSVNATIGPLLGSYATVVASGTLGGTAVAGTAVCFVSSLDPIGGAVGDLMTQDVTWDTHGTVTGFGL